MPADEPMPLRKGQGKMQKQSRLEQSSRDVAPINRRIKSVEFSGVMERVGNERDQAENIKLGRARRGPAPQQNIQPNAKIDKANQAQPVVLRPLGRNRNQHHIHRHRLPYQGVGGLRPRSYAIQFAGSSGRSIYLALVDGGKLIPDFDAGSSAGSANLRLDRR